MVHSTISISSTRCCRGMTTASKGQRNLDSIRSLPGSGRMDGRHQGHTYSYHSEYTLYILYYPLGFSSLQYKLSDRHLALNSYGCREVRDVESTDCTSSSGQDSIQPRQFILHLCTVPVAPVLLGRDARMVSLQCLQSRD